MPDHTRTLVAARGLSLVASSLDNTHHGLACKAAGSTCYSSSVTINSVCNSMLLLLWLPLCLLHCHSPPVAPKSVPLQLPELVLPPAPVIKEPVKPATPGPPQHGHDWSGKRPFTVGKAACGRNRCARDNHSAIDTQLQLDSIHNLFPSQAVAVAASSNHCTAKFWVCCASNAHSSLPKHNKPA